MSLSRNDDHIKKKKIQNTSREALCLYSCVTVHGPFPVILIVVSTAVSMSVKDYCHILNSVTVSYHQNREWYLLHVAISNSCECFSLGFTIRVPADSREQT